MKAPGSKDRSGEGPRDWLTASEPEPFFLDHF